MKNVTVIRNGREYPALETRNITAGNEVGKRYEQYRIKVVHNGLVSKFTVKPNSFWDDAVYAGSFHYDFNNDRITWFLWSDYDPAFIFIFVDMVNVLDDGDVVIIYNNKIYIQKSEPSEMLVNDIWVDTSVMPYKSYKKISASERQNTKLVANAVVAMLSGSGGGNS